MNASFSPPPGFGFSIEPTRLNDRLFVMHLSITIDLIRTSYRDNTASAITFKAEEGKVYYFRTQPTPTSLAASTTTGVPNGEVELAKLDPAQAQLMLRKWGYSTSQPKK
jgi:hypothetical protein